MKEVQLLINSATSLGLTPDLVRGEARMTLKRRWRLDGCIRWLLRRRTVSGPQLQIVVGHATFASLLDRTGLVVFHAVHAFVAAHGAAFAPLWSSARAELLAFAALLPCLRAEWRRPWSSQVSISDASAGGWAHCLSAWPVEHVVATGRLLERDRFRRVWGTGPREDALAAARASDESGWDPELAALEARVGKRHPSEVACLVKRMAGRMKSRLILDVRRSGINQLIGVENVSSGHAGRRSALQTLTAGSRAKTVSESTIERRRHR